MNADEFLDGYVAWREECQVVGLAFETVGPPVAGAIAERRAPGMSPPLTASTPRGHARIVSGLSPALALKAIEGKDHHE